MFVITSPEVLYFTLRIRRRRAKMHRKGQFHCVDKQTESGSMSMNIPWENNRTKKGDYSLQSVLVVILSELFPPLSWVPTLKENTRKDSYSYLRNFLP